MGQKNESSGYAKKLHKVGEEKGKGVVDIT